MDTPGMDYERLTGTMSQERVDQEHLGTLALCHYILGGVTALFSSLFIIHIVMGLTMAHNPNAFTPPLSPSAPTPVPVTTALGFPSGMGYLFAIMGTIAVLGGWTLGGLTVYAGRCLAARKNSLFILIVAGINCAFVMPLGTLLGVFTIVVLTRPTVKVLFDRQPEKETL